MAIIATIGATALYLLFVWLISAAAASWLTGRKGYGERLGLAFGLLLSAIGLVMVLLLPGRPGSRVEDRGAAAASAPARRGLIERRRAPAGFRPCYRPGRIRISSVDPNPISAPGRRRAARRGPQSATAAATAPTTSRLNTDGMM